MRTGFLMAAMMVMTVAFASGCGQTTSTPAKPLGQNSDKPASTSVASDDSKSDVPNDGWWCKEHGIPEGICAQCSSKVAAEFQKKGDWCKEHDRPESQCFICHPELEAKFASQYEAKYGKKPPKPEG